MRQVRENEPGKAIHNEAVIAGKNQLGCGGDKEETTRRDGPQAHQLQRL